MIDHCPACGREDSLSAKGRPREQKRNTNRMYRSKYFFDLIFEQQTDNDSRNRTYNNIQNEQEIGFIPGFRVRK